MKSIQQQVSEKPWLGWVIFTGTLVAVFLIGLFASSVMERRTEALYAYQTFSDIGEWEADNAKWGQYYPQQYQSWLKTAEGDFESKYGGNVMRDMLEEDPNLVVLWAGYPFSKEYNQGRGHMHAIEDIVNISRTGAPETMNDGPMPGTCWTCKGPDVPRMMQEIGITAFYGAQWASLIGEIKNPIGCADCHDPKTMSLQISRPALAEAFKRKGQDLSKATHQEMRSLVCAQCHVEYYFKKDVPGAEGVNYLTLPWDQGFSAESMEAYYDAANFKDWTHSISKTPMLKAQHPDYELYTTGVHANRGISCADCHMPYRSEGGMKFSDHHKQSPLNNISNSCQVCHREDTERLIADVYERQERILESRLKLEELLVKAHVEAGKAWEIGTTPENMNGILQDIRHAQWRWDYIAASHGGSFHSPVESGRVLSSGIALAQEARVKLARVLTKNGVDQPISYPDISTKAKAQEYIGLDMKKENAAKKEFLEKRYPEWVNQPFAK